MKLKSLYHIFSTTTSKFIYGELKKEADISGDSEHLNALHRRWRG